MYGCRICLKNKLNLKSFFEPIENKYLPAVVYNISGVKILRKLEPKAQICSKCKSAILSAENIILQCQETEEFIQCTKFQDNNRNEINGETESLNETTTSSDTGSTDDTHEEADSKSLDSTSIDHARITTEGIDTKEKNEVSKTPNDTRHTETSSVYLLPCEHCDFKCKTARGLVKHRKDIHKIEDENIFPCQMCDKRFPWKSSLNRHIQNYHNILPEDKKFSCTECGNVYISDNHLKEHQKQRHGPRRFKCVEPHCKQTFTRPFTLRRHFLCTHQNITRYHCLDCNEYFKIYDHWKYHNKSVHNDENRDFHNYKRKNVKKIK